MNFSKYDNRYVIITCNDGKTYEGICIHNNSEYCEHEFGRAEDCFEIMNFLFFKEDIKNIEAPSKNSIEYKSFLNSFDDIQKNIVDDGIEEVTDFLLYNDEPDEHIIRLLNCLLSGYTVNEKEKEELKETLINLQNISDNAVIIEKAKRISEMF